jgi:hypothetical protein
MVILMARKNKSSFVHKLARVGAVSIGIVYVLIGVIALLSLMQLRSGGADESSVLNLMKKIPFGEGLISLIFLGLLAYIFWKFYNALEDPYGYGTNTKGVFKRIGLAAAGLGYGVIAWSAIMAALNLASGTHGHPTDQRQMVWNIFQWNKGELLVGIFGGIVAIVGIAQFVYVIKKGYREKLRVQAISKTKKTIIAVLAWAGHFARGTILLIIAYFIVRAAMQSNASEVVNTDKAFNFLGDQVNHLSFILVAAGTICYGFYMFSLSLYYDFQDDF